MSYDVEHVAELGHVKQVAESVKARLDTTIKYVSVSGNTISFFKTPDGSGTAAYTVDFPTEFLLDQAKTTFVSSFAFSTTTYPGATNPNLNGKPVLVLAVKGTDGTTTYSFLNMASLIDTYTVASGNSAKILTISGRAITVNISAVSNNAITVQSDGLHVNISGKADRVSGATNGNFAGLDANGNLIDSGVAKSTVTGYATSIAAKASKLTGNNIVADNLLAMNSSGDLANSGISKSTVTGYATTIATKATKLTGSNITANNLLSMNSSGDLANSGISISTVNGKATKVSSATADHLATLTSAGDLADSGIAKTTIAAKIDKVTSATANRIAVFASGGGLADGGVLISSVVKTSDLATTEEVTEMLTEVFGAA